MNNIENRKIGSASTLLSALKQMDAQHVKMLFVFEDDLFVSILTVGDIQRAIVKNIDLESPVSSIVVRDKKFAHEGDPMETIREKMLRLRAECMPVLNDDGELVDVIFWKDLFHLN